ncbi:MAG: hypothetical protein LQ338_007666 [Usnochroma carphineum]|nr:MAG: hypothetical protein LQ338_007666 [Usnochroma carphineum]
MAEHNTEHSQQNGVNGIHTHEERNAWSSPGPAAFDFRSDVVTTPTPSMLRAIESCTLLDDVFAEDPTTQSLESHIASLTGHPAALLVLSGTMGNQLSIRTHLTQPPHSILADARSHIYEWEAGGVSSLSGAFPILVHPSNTHHLTLSDIQSHIVLPATTTNNKTNILNIHHAPTPLISLENTLNGSILPLSDCRATSTWARAQDPPIKLHLDGARLWEAAVALSDGGGNAAAILKDYCALFDSVSLCFSKGLGAPIGSVIVGSEPFISRARHIRKALGGGLRQAGVIAAPARVAVDETFLGGRLRGSHEMARRVGEMWEAKGGKLGAGGKVETNMVWFDLEASGVTVEEFVEEGVREGVKLAGGRVVVHYQVGEEGVRRLGRVMDRVLGKGRGGKRKGEGEGEGEGEVKEVARSLREEGEGME